MPEVLLKQELCLSASILYYSAILCSYENFQKKEKEKVGKIFKEKLGKFFHTNYSALKNRPCRVLVGFFTTERNCSIQELSSFFKKYIITTIMSFFRAD